MDQSPIDVATRWFAAYSSGDYEGMKALAAPDYVFEDPAFGRLEGNRALAMYKMFLSGRDRSKAVWNVHEVKPSTDSQKVLGSPPPKSPLTKSPQAIVRFEAVYKFNGRPVTNQITSNILVVDGRVKEQIDKFDVPTWAGQALGIFGWLFGNFSFFQNSVKQKANARLDMFIAKHPDLQENQETGATST
ncbi:hypothetical protein FRC10_005330 [Ceratobasidium sp. 414]|nr:hypothetical protein FRC10_005330 [Ceratobasidium sp. 414]